jgi:hypothetical protein
VASRRRCGDRTDTDLAGTGLAYQASGTDEPFVLGRVISML